MKKYLSFFHNSEEYLEEFTSKEQDRPCFYWFGDRYFNHVNPKIGFDYFNLFVKNPKEDDIALRARHEEGLGFHSLYQSYLDYLKYRDDPSQIDTGGNYEAEWAEPAILMSFSKIAPDLIAKWDSDNSETFTIIKPDKWKGLKVTAWDKERVPRRFIEIPEIVEIVPKIKQAFPIIEPEKRKGKYVYEDWKPMITEKMGFWM